MALKVPSVTARSFFCIEKSKKSASADPLICESVERRGRYVGGDLSHTSLAHSGGGVILTMKKPVSCRSRDAKIMVTLDDGSSKTLTERTMTERRMPEGRNVPDSGSWDRVVVFVGPRCWGNLRRDAGNLEWGGNGEGLRKGRLVYE